MRYRFSISTISVLLWSILQAPLFAQEDRVARIWSEIDSINANVDPEQPDAVFSPWSYNTTVGTSYAFSPGYGSAMQMFAAPQLNYAATNRLALHGGVMVGQTVPVTGLVSENMPVSQGWTNISTYVAASYRLTENLVVHGAGARSMVLFPIDGQLQTMEFNDLSIGAT